MHFANIVTQEVAQGGPPSRAWHRQSALSAPAPSGKCANPSNRATMTQALQIGEVKVTISKNTKKTAING